MNVVIVGAGIGGLTLAAALHREGISARIYERDLGITARQQGYALSLKESTGLKVLRTLGLYEDIRAVGRPAIDFTFLTPEGKDILHLRADPSSPEYTLGVPRDRLRTRLLEAVPAEWLTWGARCTGVSRRGSSWLVEFEDQEPVEAGLVVAADGVRSALRKVVVGDELHYLGLQAVGGATGSEVEHPLLAAGAFMTLGKGASIFVQRFSDEGKTIWSFCAHAGEKALDALDGQALKDWARERTQTWHEPIPTLMASTSPSSVVVRGYYDRNPLRTHVHPGVVLMGDAAHPMSPFQGQGANMAMVDALELAVALRRLSHGETGALAEYERAAVKRNRDAVMRSRMAARLFHSRGAVSTTARNMGLRLVDKFLPKPKP
ncbi:MAG TPA: NAD(P)/FAD-dependent oxidoreductase [Archangium sp.]|jgi:2-polyprenyl-6-methoxyphenol hydroxylase-like FAD-dependent oxidoreductase